MYLQIIRSFIANSIKIKLDGRSLVAVGADFSAGKYCFEFEDSQIYHCSKPYSSYSEALKESRLYTLKQYMFGNVVTQAIKDTNSVILIHRR